MSKLFDKSVSEKYKKYFEPFSTIIADFKQFSLSSHQILKKESTEFKYWDKGEVGVPLGWSRSSNTITVDHTDAHTLVIGPTGSKKSRLIAMPLVRILGSAGESMIISDPKAEIYNRTASYLKKQHYDICILNLRSPNYGDGWNPLEIPYKFFCAGDVDKAYEFVNDIAENLIQSNKSQNDPFWDNSAGSLFFGLVLLLFKYCKDFNEKKESVHIGNVIRLRNELFSESNGKIKDLLWKYAKSDYIIASSLIGTVETAKDTRSGILSVFDQKIRMFSIQPNLLDMLSYNNINFDTIGCKPTAIFLILPDEKTSYHNLVSLFIKQSYEYIIHKAQSETEIDGFQVGKLSNRVNYILDEFSSLPTIKDFPAMITASRSRNIRFTLIVQSKHQLIQRYGEETDTIQTNCNNWIFLTSRELNLLEEISSLCGKTNESNPKPILSVSSLQWLDKNVGEVLLLVGRYKPCITHLPDIDEYDDNKYETLIVNAREKKDLHMIDFASTFVIQQENQKDGFMKIPLTQYETEKLIMKIDQKIAEFNKEDVFFEKKGVDDNE